MKLQSEVYVDESRRRTPYPRGRFRPAVLQQLSESGAKVTLTMKDGTEREVKSHEELLAVFAGLKRERQYAERVQKFTDAQIDQRLSDLEQRINNLKKLRWMLTTEDQRLFSYVILRPLEKYLELLTIVKERRTINKDSKS
jgi:hypothetical protein